MIQDFSQPIQQKIRDFTRKIRFIPLENMDENAILQSAQEIAKQVLDLKEGQDFWLEGGGNDHAMFYQFIKKSDHTYDIYIHNTGAGLQYHYQESKRGGLPTIAGVDPNLVKETSSDQVYVCPFVKYEGISEAELGLNIRGEIDPALFVKLISIKKSRQASQKEAVDQIYLGCFGAYNKKRIADPRTRSDFTLITPQRSGTCSWKVLVYAALRTYLADSKLWQKVELDLRQNAFERSCHSDVQFTSDGKELCLQGGRELQRQLASLHEVFLSQEEAEARRMSIQSALEGLKPKKSQTSISEETRSVSYQSVSKDLSLSNSSTPIATPEVIQARQTVPFSASPLQVDTLVNVEKELQKIIQFEGEDHLYDLPMQIERLVDALPRPSQLHNAWQKATLEEITRCQSLFSKVLTLYKKHILAHQERILSEQNTAWALLAVIHHLSGKIDPQLVSKYGIYFDSLQRLMKQPTFTNFLPKDLDLYRDLVSYFQQTGSTQKLFDIGSIQDRAIRYEDELLPDEIFLLERARKVPAIYKELQEKVEKRLENEFYKKHSISEDRIEREIVLSDNELFSAHPETAYITFLRKAAYDAQDFIYDCYFRWSSSKEFPVYTRLYERQKAVTTFHLSFNEEPHRIPDAKNAFDLGLISRGRNCLFDQFSQNHENTRVNDLAKVPTRLEAATCQKTLQSQLLVEHFKDNISDLSQVKNQNLFLLSLFRSFSSGMPVQEAIANPAFLQAVFQFVDKGLSLYLYGSKRPDIKTTLFFIQVIRRLKELDPAVPFFSVSKIKEFSSQKNPPERFLPDYTSEINELLKRDDLTEEEENLLHIHRILQYSSQKTLLNNLNTLATSQNQALQEIVESWMHCSSYKFHSWHSYHSFSEAAHLIYELAPVFEKLSLGFWTDVINHLVPTDKLRAFSSFIQTKGSDFLSPLSLYSINSQEGTWSLSPLHGRILLNGEEVTFGVRKDLTESKIYTTVFGSQKFHLRRQGSAFIFQNEKGNKFRIFEKGKETVLQLQWEGEWFQFLTGESDLTETELHIFSEKIPKPLIADHFVFRSSQKILFVNKKTFAVDFEEYKGLITDKTRDLTESSSLDFYSTIERFEQKAWILESKDKEGIVTVQFPRFKSLDGDDLEFLADPQGISWRGDRRFLLKADSRELLGHNRNYLLLQNGEKTKILLPCKPVAVSKKFAPHAYIDIQDRFRSDKKDTLFPLYNEDLSIPQQGVYRFLEYNIEKGAVVPLNAEGAFFLSYVHFTQKDYVKALQILKNSLKLKEHLTLTPESQDILLWLITHPVLRLKSVYEDSQDRLVWEMPKTKVPSYDQSASAAALGLRAALFLLKDYTSPLGQQRDLSILRSVIPKLWESYQIGLKEVDADLRFSFEELAQLKKLCESLDIHLDIFSDSSWPEVIREDPSRDAILPFYMEHASYYKEILKFKEVYNAFQRAKTVEERTFLKVKFWKFLTEKTGIGRGILSHVINSTGHKYSPYPEDPVTREAAEEWLKQFDSPSSIELLPVNTPDLSRGKTFSSVPIERPLAESLHKAKALSVPTEFVLAPLSLAPSPFLKSVVDKYFKQSKNLERKSLISSDLFSQKPILPFYKTAVEQERADFLQEYLSGLAKNREEIRYCLQSAVQLQDVHKQLQTQLEDHLFKIENLRNCIQNLVNKLPSEEKQRTLTLLLTEGRAQSLVKMDQIVNAFLTGKSQSYIALNSHMRQEDIENLDELVKTFLILSIEANQIEKALVIQDPQELGRILSEGISYLDPKYEHLWRQFLVYEYRSGLRMREEQVALILTMSKEKSCVTQLMMGGGKTSVVASNLLYLAAQPGRIAFFIPPAAQFSTLIENLGNMQKKHFHQGVTPIQLQRSQLTEKNLLWVQEQVEMAKKDRRVILTTRETIEALNLEYLDLLHKKDYTNPKLRVLFHLVKEIKQFGDALIDEVDLILNPMQETNFPIGERMRITPELIEMTRQLFKLLVSHDKLRLVKNEQAVLSESAHRKILLEVFTKFFDEYEGFFLEPTEKESFLKFIAGHPASRSFKTVLKLRSKNEELKKSADAISLTKHLSADVLPLTLSKSTGEGYGRVLDEDVVGPYHGVASPTFTEFGSQWEAMLYHFQTVLSKGVTANQVKELYENFFASASYQVATSGVILDDTWEAQTFKALTGYSFSEFNKPGYLESALQKINSNQDLQLLLEANTIAQVVGYYVQYLRSTSQNFVENFSGFDSFSGTPWNIETYSRSLQEGYYPDVGTEGKIIDVFLERSQKDSKIHTTQILRPKETLSSVLQNMKGDRKKRVSGFIDSAGLFKESDGLSVAKEVLQFYGQEDRIQTVLFFGRPTPRSPMVLMALKKGFEKPIVIGSTQAEEIAKYGIAPQSTFVYYDQTHCEATDILQKEDAINIISVNHKMIRRSFTQGVLRLRAYFKGQDIEIVLPQEEVELFTGTSKILPTHQDVLVKIVDNQAVKKADQTFRAYKQKIDNALRQVAMDELIKTRNWSEQFSIFERFKELFVVQREQNLYEQFGAPETWIDSLQALEAYRNWKEGLFKRLTTDQAILESASTRLDQILESARKTAYRPTEVKKKFRDDVGTEVEISQEVQVEVSVDLSLNRELQQELDLYQQVDAIYPVREISWRDDFVPSSLRVVEYQMSEWMPRVYSLKDILMNKEFFNYQKDYFKLFSGNLLVSRNFIQTFNELTTVFYKKQKHAGQILLIREGDELKAILVSTLEASFFKKYIEKNNPDYMWLILPTGAPFIGKAPEMTPELQDLLWQVKLLNGNVEELLKDPMTRQKRKRLNKDLLHDFLALKVEYDSKQRGVFYQHFVESADKKKDLLSFFRTTLPSTLHTVSSNFESYHPLIAMGISKKEIDAKSVDVREALFVYAKPLKQLKNAGIDIKPILDLPCGDLVKILENAEKVIGFIKKGLHLDTLLRVLKPKSIHD